MGIVCLAAGPRRSSRGGAALTVIGPGIWSADRRVRIAPGVEAPERMLVLRQADGSLTLYGSVALDAETGAALDSLGRVTAVVAPNRHHDPALAYAARYAGLRRYDAAVPPPSAAGFEPYVVELSRLAAEVCGYHAPSRTLMLCDLAVNVRAGGWLLRLLLRANGAWGALSTTRLQRHFALQNVAVLADFYRWAMAKPFTQIAMAHGDLVTAGARETFYQAFHRFTAPAAGRATPTGTNVEHA